MFGIGRRVGKQAVDGAVERIKELVKGFVIEIGEFNDFTPNSDIKPRKTFGIKFRKKL